MGSGRTFAEKKNEKKGWMKRVVGGRKGGQAAI